MPSEFYGTEKLTAAEAKFEAQKIAFAPFVFQAAVALRDLGILIAVEAHGEGGATAAEVAEEVGLPLYGVKVLLEAGAGIGLLLYREEKYILANTGYFVLHDRMTRVNIDFVRDVNYDGFAHLQEAMTTGKPEGLRVFGNWRTIYQALSCLPVKVRQSWLAFDQFYSDCAFRSALPLVFEQKPTRLLDVGGNTGRWALECVKYDGSVHVTIADLEGQVRAAEKILEELGAPNRISYYPIDILDSAQGLPPGYDTIWMSQFLDCFSAEEIVFILKKVAKGMGGSGRLFILETYQDRQQHEAAAFCLQQTSLYFACMANGNSRMYHSGDMKGFLDLAGFEIVQDTDRCGISHTLFMCRKKL